MDNVIQSEILEKVLLSRWADFLDIRKLRHHVSIVLDLDPNQPQQLQISRFEITKRGFFLWIEVHLPTSDKHITVESYLSNLGELSLLRMF
jgi:hypothetical protein